MDKDEILKLGKLSRLKLQDDEVTEFQNEIGSILDYVKQIETINIEDTKEDYALKNVMREDTNPHQRGEYTQKILTEAPDTEGNYIKVKQIFE